MTVAAPHPEPRALPWLAGLLAFATTSAAIVVAVWHADGLPEAIARGVSLAFFLLIVPFEVLIHEGGHMAAAKLLGWRVALLSWGPFTLRMVPLKLVFGAPAFGSSAAGAVVAVPPPGRDKSWAWALLFAAGPFANAVLAAAAIAASIAAPSETPRALFVVTAVISALSGLYNLVPRGGSDGAQLMNVLRYRNGPWRGLNARLTEQTLRGIRPRDWSPELMRTVERLALWSDNADLQLLLYAWRLDRGEIGAARNALSGSRPDERIVVELAFCAAWFDHNAASARALLSRTGSWSIHGQTCYWRAAAALAVISGDRDAAREALRKGRMLVREGPYATAFDAEWFDTIERDLP